MTSQPQPAAHSLARYYSITAINSVAMTIVVATIFFWTRSAFHYSNTENLWLGMCFGLTGVPGSRYGGRLADRLGPDRLLFAVFASAAVLLITGWMAPWHYAPFILALLYGLVVNATWPALESAVFHVDSPLTTPQRLSAYNIAWSLSNTVGLLISSLLVGWLPASVLWGPGILHAATFALLLRFRPAPIHHSPFTTPSFPPPAPSTSIAPDRKRSFMHAAWLGNALTYVMIAVLLPLLPSLSDRLGKSPSLTIIMACTFYLTRSMSFFLFGRWEHWHYHRGWNMAALVITPLAFAGIMLTTSLPFILLSLAVFGVSLGLTYSSSIYYSLDFGTEKGEQGGLHEAIIGIGNLAGPLIGLAGIAWIGDPHGAPLAALSIVTIGTFVAIGLLPRPSP
jgi:MFS family permease